MDKLLSDDNRYIDPNANGHTVSCPDDLCSVIHPNLTMEYVKPDCLRDKAVLAPTNAVFNTPNYHLLSQLPSQECCHRSVDTVTDLDQVTHLPTEFLNSQDPPELHPS